MKDKGDGMNHTKLLTMWVAWTVAVSWGGWAAAQEVPRGEPAAAAPAGPTPAEATGGVIEKDGRTPPRKFAPRKDEGGAAPAGALPAGAGLAPATGAAAPGGAAPVGALPGAAPATPGQEGPGVRLAPGGVVVPGGPGAFPPGGMPGAAPENTVAVQPPANQVKINTTGVTDIPCKRLGLDEMVSLDFKEIPLDDLIRLISCWTEKNFLIQGGFQGKTITLMSPMPVTVAEAYKAFLAVLRSHGLTVVPSGKFLKVVPDAQSKQEGLPIYKESAGVPNDEGMVTKLVKLKYVPASELSQVLSSFKGKSGEILAYGEDTLIITDAGFIVRKLMEFVTELDRPSEKEKIWVRPVQYAEAAAVVEIINGVFGDDGSGRARPGAAAAPRAPAAPKGPRGSTPAAGPSSVSREGEEQIKVTKLLADERTNQLILMCNSSTYMQVDKLLRKMDVPIPGEGGIHIYYLENADAEELASTLSGLSSGGARGGGGGRGGAAGGAPRPAGAAAGGGGGVAGLFEGEVKITAHKQTNSLIVEASLKDFTSMKKVIELLDIRRKQVYVEAMIMEISSNKERKFGMSGSAGTTVQSDGETVPILFGLGGLGISGFDSQQLTKGGLAVGMQGPLVDVSTGNTGSGSSGGNLSVPTFGFLLQAIASNSDVNILSTPHILTTDNEEAEIQVGKQIPYQASSMGGLGGLTSMMGLAGGLGGLGGLTGNRTNSSTAGGYGGMGGLGGLGGYGGLLGGLGMGMVQRIDVDLTLKITPHVNESNFVRLEIDQSIEDVESIDLQLGPTTSKRKVKNTVVVRDQQPVVIGGLIRDTQSDGVDKVPFLGDIPLVGVFFRKTVKRTEKKNLLMIIVPHIINDPSDLERIHRERMEETRRFAEYLATRQLEASGIVDYDKKNGGLEHMRQVVDRARKDREMRERAEFEGTAVDTVGPPETHDLEYDPTALPVPDAAPGAPGQEGSTP